MTLTTTGLETFSNNLRKYGEDVIEKTGDATENYVDNIRDEYKARSRVKTGDNRRHTKSEISRKGPLIRAAAFNDSDHVEFLEKGHMVRKGQIFFDKDSGTFKRVKSTRFIKGDHQFEYATEAHRKDYKRDLLKAVKYKP